MSVEPADKNFERKREETKTMVLVISGSWLSFRELGFTFREVPHRATRAIENEMSLSVPVRFETISEQKGDETKPTSPTFSAIALLSVITM